MTENTILLFVLVNFLEILVGIDLQFAASSFITRDDTVLMELESRDGPRVINAALNAVAKCACLVMSADEEKHLLCIANRAYAYRECSLRNLGNIAAKESRVNNIKTR